jgi:hypothetical protein
MWLFKDQGEDVNVSHPETGHTPLTFAIELKSRRFIGALMEESLRAELDINKPGAGGLTPLKLARDQKQWSLAVNALAARGAKEE